MKLSPIYCVARPRTVAIAFLLASLWGTAGAQQLTQPADLVEPHAAEDSRRYAVELIIFEYNSETAGNTEVFLPDQLPLDQLMMDQLSTGDRDPGDSALQENSAITGVEVGAGNRQNAQSPVVSDRSGNSAAEDATAPPDIELQTLDPDAYSLTEVFEKLDRLDAYSPVFHAGWTQIAEENGARQPIELTRLGAPPPGLEGDLTLYLGRYLHLAVELALQDRKSSASSAQSETPFYGDSPMRDGFGRSPYGPGSAREISLRIDEDRIFRNGEIRYFDHPRYGMVAKVTRVAEDPALPEQPGL